MGSNKNPRYDRVQAPDQIVQADDLTPQAKVVGAPYQQATARNVADAPTQTAMSQLGNAMVSINPQLQALNKIHQEKEQKDDIEQAKRFHETATRLADGTRSGAMPPGKSQLFNDTVMSLDARTYANQYGPALQEAWAKNPDSTNPDKPNSFQEFSQKFRSDWDNTHNINADNGNQKFTPHQLSLAKQKEIMDGSDEHLANHNAAVRIDELTKKGEDTLGRAITSSITAGLKNMNGDPLSPDKVDYASIAKSAMASITDQTTGLVVKGGLPWSSANKVAVTSFMQAAIDSKDPGFLAKIGPHLDALDPAHPITGTQLWKQHKQTTNEHIISTAFAEKQHRAWEQDRVAQGGDDAINARTAAKTKYDDSELDVKVKTKADGNIIMGFKDLMNMTPEETAQQKNALDNMRKYDAPKANFFEREIRDFKEHAQDRIDKDKYGETEVGIYQAIEKSPGSYATNELIDSARMEKRIDSGTWQRLRQESREMGKASIEFKGILDNQAYTNLEQGVKNGLVDPTKPFGEASIAAASAAHEFRMTAINILRKNPGMTVEELSDVMEPKMKQMHLKYNAQAKTIEEGRKVDAEQQKIITDAALKLSQPDQATLVDKANKVKANEGQSVKLPSGEQSEVQTPEKTGQIIKAEAKTLQLAAEDKAPKTKGPAPDKLGEYLSKQDRSTISEAVKLRYEPGIEKKPIDDVELRDRIRSTFRPFYSDVHELNDAVSGFIKQSAKHYEKKKK